MKKENKVIIKGNDEEIDDGRNVATNWKMNVNDGFDKVEKVLSLAEFDRDNSNSLPRSVPRATF